MQLNDIYGIQFTIDKPDNLALLHIFSGLKDYFHSCCILNRFTEIYSCEDNKPLLDTEVFSFDYMYDSLLNEHYVIFFNILIFNNKHNIRAIKSFKEFAESDCTFIAAINDSKYVQIVCKDKQVLEQVISNCNSFLCENIELLHKDYDYDKYIFEYL